MVTTIYSVVVNGQHNVLSSIPINRQNKSYHNGYNYNLLPDDGSSESFAEQARNALIAKLNKIVIRGGIFALIMAIILTAIPFIGIVRSYLVHNSVFHAILRSENHYHPFT